MDVTIHTSDPDVVTAERLAALLQADGLFVAVITVFSRETGELTDRWEV